ncbi:MAG: hypothetical protein R6X32_02340 [Chloroflexota bacterium]|jgi:hypothetical protein
MNSSASPSEKPIPLHYLLPAVAVGSLLLLLCLGLLLFNWQQAQNRPLKPARPNPTPAALIISREPESVTFSRLNEDPFAYIHHSIQVNGTPILLPLPNCTLYNGPVIRWALVAEELQLNGRGYERIMRQVAPDVTLTVKGIWRLYEGPLGCGKGPPSDSLWYLEVIQIVAPNPLPLRDGTLLDLPIQPADPLATLEPAPTPDPRQPTATPTLTGGTATPTPIATSSTPGTPTSTPTLDPNQTASPTPTLGTTTPTATSIPGATVTSTPTPSPSPTNQAGPPPPATATPDSYQPPPPPATPTPDDYD